MGDHPLLSHTAAWIAIISKSTIQFTSGQDWAEVCCRHLDNISHASRWSGTSPGKHAKPRKKKEKRTSDMHSNSPAKAFRNTGNPTLQRKHLGKHETHSPAKEYKNRLKARSPAKAIKEPIKAH
jgi:hypothetical protein